MHIIQAQCALLRTLPSFQSLHLFTGINLTNESQGIFPSVYATDLEFYDVNKDTTVKQPTHKQYKLHFLGSMEVSHHKGSDILVDAIEKVSKTNFHFCLCLHIHGYALCTRMMVQNTAAVQTAA